MSDTLKQTTDLANVLDYLDRTKGVVQENAPNIAQRFERLKEQIGQSHEDDPYFRTLVAYAVQDFSRVAGQVLPDSHPLAKEMTELATSAPNIQSKEVQQLMVETSKLKDQRLVDQIREVVDQVSSGMADPEHPDVMFSLDKIHEAINATSPVNHAPDDMPAAGGEQKKPGLHPSPGGGQSEGNASPSGQTGPKEEPERAKPHTEGAAQRDPAGGDKNASSKKSEPDAQTEPEQPVVQKMSMGAALVGGFSRLAGALASKIEAEPSSLSPGWLDRAREKSSQHDAARAEKDMDRTAQLGSEAVEAMQALRQGPGSSIMAAIADAAANNPGGMSAVLSEMKPGGRYESLHGQFVSEKENNQAFASNLESAAEKLGAYGKGREAAQKIAETMGTTTRVEQRFAQIDAQIGKEAEGLPGTKPGTSMIEELSEKAKELVKKAAETLASIFRAAPTRGPTMSPG